MKKILVIGSAGQIGSELVLELRKRYGAENVVATDLCPNAGKKLAENGLFEVKWPKGNLRYQWNYKDGIRADGISKSWFPDGRIKYTTYWKDGKEYKRERNE